MIILCKKDLKIYFFKNFGIFSIFFPEIIDFLSKEIPVNVIENPLKKINKHVKDHSSHYVEYQIGDVDILCACPSHA